MLLRCRWRRRKCRELLLSSDQTRLPVTGVGTHFCCISWWTSWLLLAELLICSRAKCCRQWSQPRKGWVVTSRKGWVVTSDISSYFLCKMRNSWHISMTALCKCAVKMMWTEELNLKAFGGEIGALTAVVSSNQTMTWAQRTLKWTGERLFQRFFNDFVESNTVKITFHGGVPMMMFLYSNYMVKQ